MAGSSSGGMGHASSTSACAGATMQHVPRQQRPASVPAESTQGKCRAASHVARHVESAADGEIGCGNPHPRCPPCAGSVRGSQLTGTASGTGRPSRSAAMSAPVRQMVAVGIELQRRTRDGDLERRRRLRDCPRRDLPAGKTGRPSAPKAAPPRSNSRPVPDNPARWSACRRLSPPRCAVSRRTLECARGHRARLEERMRRATDANSRDWSRCR